MHGTPAVATVPAAVGALTEEMVRSMIMFRLKVAAVVLALAG
jgi:hypothetical protein